MPLPTVNNVEPEQARAFGYGVRINDTYYRLTSGPELPTVQIETAPLEPPRIDTAAFPEDISPEFGTFFSRSDFSGGEGLDFAHKTDADRIDTTRFWDSSGMDVSPPKPGESAAIRLLNDTEEAHASTYDTPAMTKLDGSLFMAEDDTVLRFDDPLNSNTFTAETPSSTNNVLDITRLGDELYVALGGTGVHKRDSSGTWSSWSNQEAQKVWAEKGRVLGADGNELYELQDGTSSILLHTVAPGDTWTDVVDVGEVIMAGSSDGYIYSFRPDPDTAELSLVTQTLIPGEQIVALGAMAGLVLIGTVEPLTNGTIGRVWRGDLTETLSVVLNLVRKWGSRDVEEHYRPTSIITGDDALLIGVNENGDTNLWRYDLITNGRVRHLQFPASDDVQDVVILEGRRFVSVTTGGLFRERNVKRNFGYLIGPLADHFTASEKSWVELGVDFTNLEGDAQVSVFYTTDPLGIRDPNHSSWQLGRHYTEGGSEQPVPLENVNSRYLAVKIEIRRNDEPINPDVRSYTVRAFPGPGDVIITLPINVSDQLERRGHHRITVEGLGHRMYRSLRNIEGTSVQVTLLSPRERLRGVVESVSTPVVSTNVKGSPTLVSVVRVRGKRITAGQDVDGSVFAAGTLGSFMFGGTEE